MLIIDSGDHGRLILELMGPGSDADKVSQAARDSTSIGMCTTVSRRLDMQLGASGLDACNGNGIAEKFADDVVNDPENIIHSVHAPVVQGPTCGQTCSGHGNPCTGGCHCSADQLDDPHPLENLLKPRYKARCKESYFAFLSPRRVLSFHPGRDALIALIEGPEPTLETAWDPLITQKVSFNRLGDIVGGAAACPCNCTYVSIACCSVEGRGLIYEAPRLQLGVLDPGEGHCCDASTGDVRPGAPKTNSTLC